VRYYDIKVFQQGSTSPYRQWTSYPGGQPDPGALNVAFDMPVLPYATPSGMQTVTIEGISLADLTQAHDFAGMNLTLSAGMGGGLPLEKPMQKGVIAQGLIFQSFGNWVGTDMTLDFVLLPSIFTHKNPGNFTLDWKKGQPLADALQATLSRVYANKLTVSINISSSLVNAYHTSHAAYTLDGLAAYVANATQKSPTGPVNITIQRGTVLVFDGTYKPAPILIDFNDLIGQPTWIDVNQMQIKTVMRSDIQVGSTITMPTGYVNAPGFVTTTAEAFPSSQKYKSTFSQNFSVIKLRQLGNFRSSDSGEWATIFNCIQNA
jgi:hypothetical protein